MLNTFEECFLCVLKVVLFLFLVRVRADFLEFFAFPKKHTEVCIFEGDVSVFEDGRLDFHDVVVLWIHQRLCLVVGCGEEDVRVKRCRQGEGENVDWV